MAENNTVAALNAKFRDNGWRSAGLERMCHGCGEDRLVTVTTIHGKTTAYCNVCSTHWVPDDRESV